MTPVPILDIEGLAPEDERLLAALGDAQPRYWSRPTPGARHDLGSCLVVAEALGTPLMPWQQLVARVATERDGRDPRRFRYPVIVLTVPRQSGKTTIMRTILTERCLLQPGRRSFYTAQTGKDAAARWSDLVKAIEAGPFRGHVQKRLAAGSQALIFPNGSTISPFAPTPKSLHGYTPHDVMCDEIFSFDAAQGNDLMGAIGPAQVTLPDRQLWLVSTMGTRDSTFLDEWVELGRASVGDPAATVAYFEWSMVPDADPYAPTSWTFHPALFHTQTVEDLQALTTQHSAGDWLRAFMNVRSVTSEAVIAPEIVAARGEGEQTPPASPRELALGFEVARDRSRSCIWAAWYDPATRLPAVRLVKSAPGSAWLVEAILNLRDVMRPRFIGADRGGAATRDVIDQLALDAPTLDLAVLQAGDFATACDAFTARMVDGRISHDRSPDLIDSIEAAVTKTLGQGWTWDRVKSRGPIPDLIAATVALRLLERSPAPAPPPMVWAPA